MRCKLRNLKCQGVNFCDTDLLYFYHWTIFYPKNNLILATCLTLPNLDNQ